MYLSTVTKYLLFNYIFLPQEKKNGIELFVSSDRPGVSEPLPAEEVIQSLNIRVLHRHLGHFGITEVSTEVCVCVLRFLGYSSSLVTVETDGG